VKRIFAIMMVCLFMVAVMAVMAAPAFAAHFACTKGNGDIKDNGACGQGNETVKVTGGPNPKPVPGGG